jgi:hypothetical protein
VIGIKEVGSASVLEMPDDKVRADDQIVHDFALHTEAHMYGVGTGKVRRNQGRGDPNNRDFSVTNIEAGKPV